MKAERPRNSKVRYSVIVPAYNAAELIEDCLRGLLDQSMPRECYEVLLVDDGSTDGTGETASRFPVRVLRQPHAGPASARNYGARAALGLFLLFTDADCIPSRTWIEELVQPLEADAQVAGVKGAYRTRQTSLIGRFCQVEFEEKYARLRGRQSIDFVDTYSAAFRREAFWQGGGFDPRFPVPSVEDAQLSFNLAAMGRRLVFAERAIVYHRHPESVLRYFTRKFRFGYWRVRVYRRHPRKMAGDSYTPLSMQLQFISLALAVLTGSLAGLRPLAAGFAALFLVATLPVVSAALRNGPSIAAVAPFVLLLRVVSLGLGLLAGTVSLLWTGRSDAGHGATALPLPRQGLVAVSEPRLSSQETAKPFEGRQPRS